MSKKKRKKVGKGVEVGDEVDQDETTSLLDRLEKLVVRIEKALAIDSDEDEDEEEEPKKEKKEKKKKKKKEDEDDEEDEDEEDDEDEDDDEEDNDDDEDDDDENDDDDEDEDDEDEDEEDEDEGVKAVPFKGEYKKGKKAKVKVGKATGTFLGISKKDKKKAVVKVKGKLYLVAKKALKKA